MVGPGFGINEVMSVKRECAVAHGTYGLRVPNSSRKIEYRIVIFFPRYYPRTVPLMFCNDPKLPIGNVDRHIMNDGSACLGVRADIGMRWTVDSTIVDFLEEFVGPFLAWQAFFDVYQQPPAWGERSHYKQGILEFYTELMGISEESAVIAFMRLLARRNRPKGHEYCPCGSGERLRNSHKKLVYDIRERVSWEDVKCDQLLLLRTENTKEFHPFIHLQ